MDWQPKHEEVLKKFLKYLNEQTDKYTLKGGTALKQCYNLNRFSEDIDLDGSGSGNLIMEICHNFASQNNYECRDAKNTDTVKRCMLHYGGIKPLKIETSLRRKNIPIEETVSINGIKTYEINILATMKASAYMQRDKIRDLYDVTFIINNYYDKLNDAAKLILRNAFEYKGLEQFDYIINTQKDELINIDKLADNFLEAYDKIGLIISNEEKQEIIESSESINIEHD